MESKGVFIKLSLLAFIFPVFLCACKSSSSSSSGASNSKSIFGQWTENNNSFSFDITGENFNTPFSIGFLHGTGEICLCNAFIIGNESAGTISVNSCSYVSGGSGDPGCAAIWENGGNAYDYTKSGSSLSICDNPMSCGTYY